MTTPLRVDGVDISHYQANEIDWAAAKRAGVKFVYHKATEGVTFKDKRYHQRRIEAAKAGVPFGAYHFASADGGDARAEARAFLDYADIRPGDLIPVLDFETNPGNLTQAQRTVWAKDFADEVERKLGVKPILYTPFAFDRKLGMKLWVARYSNANALPNIPSPWVASDVVIRQFSDGIMGVPNGVPGFGHVDLNTLPGGVKSLQGLIYEPEVPELPEPERPSEREAQLLRLGTANLQAAVVRRNPRKAAQIIINAFEEFDVDMLAVSEYGEMYESRDESGRSGHQMVKAAGIQIYNGEGKKGQGSTPVLVRPGLKIGETYSFPLLPKSLQGLAGAGASKWLKAKWLNIVVVAYNGRRIPFGCVHGPSSIQRPIRRKLADRFFLNALEALDNVKFRGLAAIGGDFNAVPGHPVLDKVMTGAGGMRSAQVDGGIKPTYGVTAKKDGRAIDDVLYEDAPRRWKLVSTEVHDTASDHHLFIATFKVFAPKKSAK